MYDENITGDNTPVITFNISYSSACWSVQVTSGEDDYTGNGWNYANSITKTGFNAVFASGIGLGLRWEYSNGVKAQSKLGTGKLSPSTFHTTLHIISLPPSNLFGVVVMLIIMMSSLLAELCQT